MELYEARLRPASGQTQASFFPWLSPLCCLGFELRKGWAKHTHFATPLQSACNSEENPPVRMCIRCILHVWCMIAVGVYGAV